MGRYSALLVSNEVLRYAWNHITGDLEQTNPFDLKSMYFYTPFRARAVVLYWVVLGNIMYIVGTSASADKKSKEEQ